MIPKEVFRPLLRLEAIFLGPLGPLGPMGPHLDTRVFSYNRRLNILALGGNGIETIDEHILELAERMLWIVLFDNVCVSRNFMFLTGFTVPMMRDILQPCFVNGTKTIN